MKITVKSIRYKNFLSTGNDWIEIKLDENPLTLIVGVNGAGKTTMIDALTFNWFGRAFRNINKPNLVNTINGSDCVTESQFIIGSKHYKIVRGIKPNIFEIWINGKMLDQDSRVTDQQKEFERKHLKFNFKAFSQVIVLGSKTYIPFMRLVAADRRAVVEDLLDIQVYSVMANIIKKQLVDCKSDIVQTYASLELAKQKVELVKANIMHNNAKTNQKLANNLHEMEKTKEAIEELIHKIRECEAHLRSLSYVSEERNEICSKREPLLEIKSKLEHNCETISKEIKFYQTNDVCPTCNQSINEIFKTEMLDKKQSKFAEIEHGYAVLQNQIVKLTDKLRVNSDNLKRINNLSHEISGYEIQISNYNDWILRIETENMEIRNNSFDNTKNNNDLVEFEKEYHQKFEEHTKLLQFKASLELAATILKDSGIKADNIKQYVPIINNYINKYLSFMDFFVNFSLDEQFEETIYHRYRDEFSYENFSDGEKLRLDLAILFAWRSVAKIKNSIDANILIMDEILDSSLDLDGVEDFFKLIGSLSGNNIFIISHKDIVTDRFQHVIKFNKVKDFSEIES